jgi:hypothetical protein
MSVSARVNLYTDFITFKNGTDSTKESELEIVTCSSKVVRKFLRITEGKLEHVHDDIRVVDADPRAALPRRQRFR